MITLNQADQLDVVLDEKGCFYVNVNGSCILKINKAKEIVLGELLIINSSSEFTLDEGLLRNAWEDKADCVSVGIPIAPIRDFTIDVVVRTQDNGDGGYSIRAYNTEDELIADHPLSNEWECTPTGDVKKQLTEEQRNNILNEDDPYENGYISHESIKINFLEGVARLSEPLYFHAGQ